jgi:hypothetical protein
VRILGVDPGAVHVGVAEWEDSRCVAAYELTPEEFAGRVYGPRWLDQFERFIAEAYVPQGGFGDGKTGTDTIKLLGLYEWTVKLRFGKTVQLVTRLDRSASLRRLKAGGYNFAGMGNGDHARDAEAVTVAGMKWSIKELDCSR